MNSLVAIRKTDGGWEYGSRSYSAKSLDSPNESDFEGKTSDYSLVYLGIYLVHPDFDGLMYSARI